MIKLKNILKENMNRFGTKNLVNEHVLGQLPSEKLMKMKWNPLTEAADMAKMRAEIANRLPDDQKGMVPWSVEEFGGGSKDLDIFRGDELMATIRPASDDRYFEIRPTKNWGGARNAGKGLVIINDVLPDYQQTLDWVYRNFGKAEPLSYDDYLGKAWVDADTYMDNLNNTDGTNGSSGTDGTNGSSGTDGSSGTGEEIYEPGPSGGFCKRNLDLSWYIKNIIPGKSYMKIGDCGIAVEVAQGHINDFFEQNDNASESIDDDGQYGPATKSAVKKVQKALDLSSDGLYGKKTHAAIIVATTPAAKKIKDLDTGKIDVTSLPPVTPTDTQDFIQNAKSRANKNKKKRKLKMDIFKGLLKGVGKNRYKMKDYR